MAEKPNVPLLPLLLLGFASGLPYILIGNTLSLWCTRAGWSVEAIAALGWVALPFTLKVLWAPVVDRFALPFGRRRGWILLAQASVAIGLLVMAACDPGVAPAPLLLAAVVVAFAAATQDIAINGYTCDAVSEDCRGWAAGLTVWGYRIALVVGGAGALHFVDALGWSAVYSGCAGLMVIGMLGTLLAREPQVVAPTSFRAAVVEPVRGLIGQLGIAGLSSVLCFLLLFRLCDGLTNALLNPFLVALDLSNQEIGDLRLVAGILGVGVGVVVAGIVVRAWGVLTALWIGGTLGALSNLGYWALDQRMINGREAIFAVLTIDQACGALAGTALVAALMRLCSGSSTATQYALLTAVMALNVQVATLAGLIQPIYGWSWFFLITTASVIPSLLLLPSLHRFWR